MTLIAQEIWNLKSQQFLPQGKPGTLGLEGGGDLAGAGAGSAGSEL